MNRPRRLPRVPPHILGPASPLRSFNDDLPKFKDQPASFGGSNKQLNNDGTPKD